MRGTDWIGLVGEAWAQEWRRTDRSFAGLEPALERAILAAAPGSAIRAIDIGCGAGTTSLAIAAALPEAAVVGLDLSADLVAIADRRAGEDTSGARCRFVAGDAVADAPTLAPVDLFFSRHGVMFFGDPGPAFARFASIAAPGAALVFSCFAALADNEWATEPLGLVAPPDQPIDPEHVPEPGPFAFADPARVGAMLGAAGWRASPPERVTFRYVAGGGADPIADAVSFFRRIGPVAAALREAEEVDRPMLLDRVAAACARRLDDGEVAFPAAAWLWSARLKEPAA